MSFEQHFFIMNTGAIIVLVTFMSVASCRDFYVGMFKKNDWLVAQDRLYKERVPYKHMYAKYGRIFKCKITYFRVADRLGYGPGPKVQIVRGGLKHKYLVLRLTSPYNMPISVNIYVGCANSFTTTKAPISESQTQSQLNTTELTRSTAGSHSADTRADSNGPGGEGSQTTAGQVAAAETTATPACI